MPQVPNRYFNNQVIADVGRNLSLAIAGSPEADAARLQQKQIEANITRQAEMDRMAQEKRMSEQEGYASLADMVALPTEDEAGRREKYSRALRHLGPSAALSSEAGKLSGAFDVKAELQRAGIEGKLDTVLKQLASDEKIAGGRNDVSREGQLLDYILGNRKITSNESIADADRVGREIVQRMRGPTGQTPIDITPAESNEMYRQVNRHSARLYDADLDPKDAAAITMLANKLYQKTRDSDVAMKTAWKMYMGDAAVQEGERWGGFGSRGRSTLVPQNPMSIEEILGEVAAASPSAQAQPQAAPGGNLSNAFTPPTPQMQRPFYQTPPPAPVAAAPGAAKISPPSPAAEKALLASPTPELKAFFKAKYGYLPPGL